MDAGNAQLPSIQDEQPGFWLSGEDTWQQIHAHNQKLLNELQVGDLVRFKRGGIYDHWAVNIGDGQVVHVTGNEDTAYTSLGLSGSSKLQNAHIKRDDFWKVAKGSWAVKGNSDYIKCPLPGEEIKQKALACVGPVNYTLTERNCEHFARQCRYGEARSIQVYGLMFALKYDIPLAVFVVLVAYVLVKMISAEFLAYAVLVLSVLVAVIPLFKASDRIRMLCLFTVIVVSGVIGHVFAANIVTASIVVTASVVPAVIKWNYLPLAEPSALVWVDMSIAGATVATGCSGCSEWYVWPETFKERFKN